MDMRTTLAMLLLLTASNGLFGQVSPREVEGCYALQLGNWATLVPEPTFQIPPDTIRLDTIKGTRMFEERGYLVRPVIPRTNGLAFWTPIGRDSIQISFTTSFTGAQLKLHVDRDTLRGTITGFTDYIIPGMKKNPAMAIIAVRAHCSVAASTPEVLRLSVDISPVRDPAGDWPRTGAVR
jgi:hypothetical protein